MKILVVSGFLGAGKTTFIKELVRRVQGNFVVLENEYADVGVDAGLLQKDKLTVWELTEGCICCSMKSDFASSVLNLYNMLDPEYLIVEPTGVGLLSAVLKNIGAILHEGIELVRPLSLVDIHAFSSGILNFGEFYRDQIKNTGQVLLSKTEDHDRAKISATVSSLEFINPEVKILEGHYTLQPQSWWEGLLSAPFDISIQHILREDAPDLEQVGLTDISTESMNSFILKVQFLMRGVFGKVYRAKGYLPVAGQWTRLDVVDTRYAVETCDEMEQARLVFIGQDLNREYLERVFVKNENLF